MKSFTIALALAPALLAQVPHARLESLRDHKRVLLVFANGDNSLAEAQLDVLEANASAAHERDLVLVGLKGSNPAVTTATLSVQEDAAARKRFGIAQGEFAVVLIGKDGGEKLRSNQPIAWEKLQSTIDGMPMRRAEILEHSAL